MKCEVAEQMQYHRSFSARFCGPARYRVSSASRRRTLCKAALIQHLLCLARKFMN